jgi:hypothetical protein
MSVGTAGIDRSNPDLEAAMGAALEVLSQSIGDGQELRQNELLDEAFGIAPKASEPAPPAGSSSPVTPAKEKAPDPADGIGQLTRQQLAALIRDAVASDKQSVKDGLIPKAAIPAPPSTRSAGVQELERWLDERERLWANMLEGGRGKAFADAEARGKPTAKPKTSNRATGIPGVAEVSRVAAGGLAAVSSGSSGSSGQIPVATPAATGVAAQPQPPTFTPLSIDRGIDLGLPGPPPMPDANGLAATGLPDAQSQQQASDNRDGWRQVGEIIGESVKLVLEKSFGPSRGGESGLAGQGGPAKPAATLAEMATQGQPASMGRTLLDLVAPTAGQNLRGGIKAFQAVRRSGVFRKAEKALQKQGAAGRLAARGVRAAGHAIGVYRGKKSTGLGGALAAVGRGVNTVGPVLPTSAAGATGAAGGVAGGMAGGVAAIAGPLAAVVSAGFALKGFHDTVADSSRQLLEWNKSFAQFSGLMGVLAMELDARDARRNMGVGDQLAESARFLGETDQMRKDNTKDLKVLFGNLENILGGAANLVITAIVGPLNIIAKGINLFVGDRSPEIVSLGEAFINASKAAVEAEKIRLERLKQK